MSEADRRRDPRAEPIEDERVSVPQVERPFDRAGAPSTRTRAADPVSASEVRAVPAKSERPPSPPEKKPAPSVPDLIDFERPLNVASAAMPIASPAPERAHAADAHVTADSPVAPTIDSLPPAMGAAEPMASRAPSAPPPAAASIPPLSADATDVAAPATATETAAVPTAAAPPAPASLAEVAMSSTTGDFHIVTTVEHLVDQARWSTLVEVLGPDERLDQLPPHLAVVYALARAETQPDDPHNVELMLRSTARAHGLADSSPIARVIAKRILRRGPTEWRNRPAPRTTISILIVFVALVLGGGGGFWLSNTKVQIPLPSFMQAR